MKGCASSSSSSPSPAASAATARRKRRARSTRAANWATCLSHACGAAFDNPELIVAAVVGDGESETGPLATSWHINKFLNPVRDGAVLPILHLNGYKINNPTLLARIPHEELESLLRGYGWTPYFVEGSDHDSMHQAMAATVEHCVNEIRAHPEARARGSSQMSRPHWPMIVLRSPKGWTAPEEVEGHRLEGFWRAHQVPLPNVKKDPEQLTHPGKLDALADAGRTVRRTRHDSLQEFRDLAPTGTRRMSANPHANGGRLKKALRLPDFRDYALKVEKPGTDRRRKTRGRSARFLRDVMKQNMTNFRVFGPDETTSNKLDAIYEVSKKFWIEEYFPEDADGGELVDRWPRDGDAERAHHGRHARRLSAHRPARLLLHLRSVRPRHRLDVQPARQVAGDLQPPVVARRSIASLNLLITSTVWRQDHNGFTHQDPGFLDVVVNKSADVTRIYLPPDVNSLLSVADHCLRSENYVNVIVSDKQKHLQYHGHGRGHHALHQGHRHLGLGEQRPGRRAGRGDGLGGRHSDPGSAGGDRACCARNFPT